MTIISPNAEVLAPAAILAGADDGLSFPDLELRSRALAGLLRERGMVRGDRLAVLLDNNLSYFEVCWAARRAGLFATPINWHLGADEAGYIIEDCGATALVTTARLMTLVHGAEAHLGSVSTKLAVDGPIQGFEEYDAALSDLIGSDQIDSSEGALMFYSSGTTGRPKGIRPTLKDAPFGTLSGLDHLTRSVYGFEPGMVYLCPAPLYHAAPLGWSLATQRVGGTVVVMERFDAEEALRAIERHRVTHAQFVPTHFIRMLRLDQSIRRRYDLSSLRTVVHAAAPCPVDVKRQMFDWLGPVIYEYYAGSEGTGFCAVGPEDWCTHPGTVGKSLVGTVHITRENGSEASADEVGQIWFESPTAFEYHNDPIKTKEAFNDRGWSTLGDVGYLDSDGFLYLTDRISSMIISGGVNIYPQEIEDVIGIHPDVADVAVIGIPDADMGEAVLAVVQAESATIDERTLAEQLQALCRSRLAGFKCPKHFRFTTALPRLPTGKLLKRAVREEFGGTSAESVLGQ